MITTVSMFLKISHEAFTLNFLIDLLAGTIPAKLILQLTTAFREGGLRDRSGKIFYKDNLHKSNVPVLALAGDKDLICPPEAVYGMFHSTLALIVLSEDGRLSNNSSLATYWFKQKLQSSSRSTWLPTKYWGMLMVRILLIMT